MKYRVTIHTTEFKRGQVVDLDPQAMQTRERLQRGIVVPVEDDKPHPAESRQTKVVEPAEIKPKRRRKKASIDDDSTNY